MRSREIIKRLNSLIDLVQDDIEESKKQKDLTPFIYHMKALSEIRFSLDLAKRHLVTQNPDLKEESPEA